MGTSSLHIMGGDGERTAKRRTKRGSRNKKKNMRKNIDLRDIEEHLESVRHDERTGGPMSKRKDEELFVIDTEPQDVEMVEEAPKSRKQRAAEKVLKLDTLLEMNPFTKPVYPRKRKKEQSSIVPTQLVGKLPKKSQGKQAKTTTQSTKSANHKITKVDLWDDFKSPSASKKQTKKAKMQQQAKENEFLASAVVVPVKPPKHERKPELSTVASVEVAAAGQSYNPSFHDHQELLKEALDEAVNDIKETKELQKKVPKMLTAEEEHRLWLKEMTEDAVLPTKDAMLAASESEDEDEDDAGDEGDVDAIPNKTIGRPENKKTKAQRRKEERQLMLQKLKKEAKEQKMVLNEVYRVKSLTKMILASLEEQKARKERKTNKKLKRLGEARILSKMRYKKSFPDLKLTKELTGSLRQLKPEGSIAKDRMDSLNRRSVIETRTPQKTMQKFKRKMYTKRSFKNYDLLQKIDKTEKEKQQQRQMKRAAKQSGL